MTTNPQVSVTAEGPSSFRVEVSSAQRTTTHSVEVPPGVAAELGWAEADPADLVRESFAFLLEREPASSILSRFSLEVIGQYFPDYAAEIRRRR